MGDVDDSVHFPDYGSEEGGDDTITRWVHSFFTFLLFCWATKGFPDINIMLSNINQLAMQQSNNYNNYA